MEITTQKIELIQKIINAKLSKDELKQVTNKTKKIISKRSNK